jgi:serine/threonine-protein kinase RsbW
MPSDEDGMEIAWCFTTPGLTVEATGRFPLATSPFHGGTMTAASRPTATPFLTSQCGRWHIPVNWDEAEELHDALKRRGCASTLCLDPTQGEARLELWPAVNPDRAAAALDELRRTAPSGPRREHEGPVERFLPGLPARDASPTLLPANDLDATALCLILHATTDIPVILDTLAEAMTHLSYPSKDIFGVRLSLEEALVNAIKHGNKGDPARQVWVRALVTVEQVLVEVQDEGSGFDPARVADPLSPEGLDRSCGRGLLLMRRYLSSVRWNERGNAVTLCKRRDGERAAGTSAAHR